MAVMLLWIIDQISSDQISSMGKKLNKMKKKLNITEIH